MPPSSSWQNIAAIVIAVVLWRTFEYFTRKSVLDDLRGPPGGKVIAGHLDLMFDIHDGLDYTIRLSDEYGDVAKLKALGSNMLWLSDVLAVEHILLKAPAVWDVSDILIGLSKMLFGPGLLASNGEQHKKQRRLLNPMFSARQASNIVPLFYNIGRQLREKLLKEVGTETKELNILDWMGRVTMEFVGQGSLGYHFHALEGGQNDYREALRELTPTMARIGIIQQVGALLSTFGPARVRRLIVDLMPVSAVQDCKGIVDRMYQSSTRFFQNRKQQFERGETDNTDREDLLSLLVRVNSQSNAEDRLSDEEAIAQLSTVMFAANDTTSGTLCRIFGLLASHPDIQTKLRQELERANADSDLNYEQLMALPLLDAVCKETLRLHPPLPLTTRRSQQDDVVPLLHPIETKSGRILKEIVVPKGTIAFIGITAINRHRSIWGSNAREWIPERWLTSDPVTTARVPGAFSSMMTFLGGERSCIGYRMAFLELKIVLSVLLPTFRFEPSSEDVVWHVGPTLAPFAKGKDGAPDRGPEMPMKLSRVEIS